MKKKVAIVLSVILACSMGMTAMAAPSPSIQKEPVAQVVVNPTVGTAGNNVAVQATSVSSESQQFFLVQPSKPLADRWWILLQ